MQATTFLDRLSSSPWGQMSGVGALLLLPTLSGSICYPLHLHSWAGLHILPTA